LSVRAAAVGSEPRRSPREAACRAGSRDIWLNEGFATYAEWLWSEHERDASAQERFDEIAAVPAEETSFWGVSIGDPGPDLVLDFAVYYRGAMTLHALRREIGDRDFFRLLRRWAQGHAGGNVTTGEFVTLAERVSGEDLDALFQPWLFTPRKPPGIEPTGPATSLRRLARTDH
jgi:aminopeptidase N